MIPNWKQQGKSKAGKGHGPGLGGLKDSDAFAKKPKVKQLKPAQVVGTMWFDGTRDFSRKNRVCSSRFEICRLSLDSSQDVAIVSESESDDFKPALLAPQKTSVPKQPSRPLTANNVRVTDLPDFTQIGSKWRKVFVPSLYNALFQSEAPFKDFVLGSSKFTGIIQDLVTRIYPEVDYTVKRDGAIHLLVRLVIFLSFGLNVLFEH